MPRPLRGQLSGQALYDKIWTTPVYKVAAQFGIHALTLAAVCRAHKIPLPTRRYWWHLNAGEKPKREPLPPSAADSVVKLFSLPKGRLKIRFKRPPADIQVPPIEVQSKGPLSHPSTLRTQRLLRDARPDDAGILVSRKGVVDHLQVSAQLLPRALRILDALLIAFSRPPFQVVWPEGGDKKLGIVVMGEYFRFRMMERLRQFRHVPTAFERFRSERDWSRRPVRFRYESTRRLKIEFRDIHGRSIRHQWSDTADCPLENSLQRFVLAFANVARELVEEQKTHGTWRQRWDRLRAVELQREKKQRESACQRAFVRRCLSDWQLAANLQELLSHLKRTVKGLRKPDERKLVRSLMRILKTELDSIDPLKNLSQLLSEFGSATMLADSIDLHENRRAVSSSVPNSFDALQGDHNSRFMGWEYS